MNNTVYAIISRPTPSAVAATPPKRGFLAIQQALNRFSTSILINNSLDLSNNFIIRQYSDHLNKLIF
jgi:hypothetical protein